MPTYKMGASDPDRNDFLQKVTVHFKGQHFYRGFVFKAFNFKQLDSSEGVRPTHEEIQNFQDTIKDRSTNHQAGDVSSSDDEKVEGVIKRTLLHGGTTEYAKGDKIQVNKGDLNGIKGVVVTIEEGGLVTFTPTGYPELTKPLQIDISMVSKYFEPGDLVRVTEAKYKGETGTVIDVEGPKVSMILDQSQQEIKIHANFLKLKSDTDQHQTQSMFGYSSIKTNLQAMDLVQYNGNKNAGLVLQINEDQIKLINEQGKIENVKIADLGKKLPAPSRGGNFGGRDSQGNALGLDQMVKCVNG